MEMDYEYIEYFRKAMATLEAMANLPDPSIKLKMANFLKYHEAMRDYFSPSLKQINHLIQFDENPNVELKEPRWEIYKVSLSFKGKGRIKIIKSPERKTSIIKKSFYLAEFYTSKLICTHFSFRGLYKVIVAFICTDLFSHIYVNRYDLVPSLL